MNKRVDFGASLASAALASPYKDHLSGSSDYASQTLAPPIVVPNRSSVTHLLHLEAGHVRRFRAPNRPGHHRHEGASLEKTNPN